MRDRGAHVSIANLIEMQMRHGMPPFQQALNHGILPSLSPDVETNMTTDPFSLMRGAFCLQRALANDLAFKESNPGNCRSRNWSRPVRSSRWPRSRARRRTGSWTKSAR